MRGAAASAAAKAATAVSVAAAAVAAALATAAPVRADPLSRSLDVDLYREVPSRELHGLAARSDGRLVAGPAFTELKGDAQAQILWCLEPAPGGKWLVGTGPSGRILEVAIDPSAGTFAAKEVAKVDEAQVFAVRRLPDGALLAGTSPKGALCLIRDGKVVARTSLPVDSIFDLLLISPGTALAATGNPARIYRIDLARFARAGVAPDKVTDTAALAARGIDLFGEIHDRNVRRIARLSDGRVVAGSAPHGSVYLFPPAGGPPFIAQENRDCEVTDLLPDATGGFYASLVFSTGDNHLNPATAKPKETPPVEPLPGPAQPEKFAGRSTLQWFPADGFPELLTSRPGVAFYRIARRGDLLIAAGGELGEMTGYDLAARLALTFSGSTSAQVSGLEPVEGAPGRFLALRNNIPGFALVDFDASGPRSAQSRPIDLGTQARIGSFRFDRLKDLADAQLHLSWAGSNGSDETEGWGPWTAVPLSDGWKPATARARYVKFRIELAADAGATLEIAKPTVYFLPQNHRPQIQDFRLLPPNYAVVVPPEPAPQVTTTVGQLVNSGDSEHHRSGFMSNQVIASPGTRVAFWNVTDADGDSLVYTFSIRREGDRDWTDLAVDSRDPYVQFDTLHLAEGTYFMRLVATEAAPRPAAERLSVTQQSDDLVVNHTPPAILEATARRTADAIVITVHGRDALSLLDSVEISFNNGVHEIVEQPADGVLDGREETFVFEEKLARASGATAAEVTLYDAAGNATTRRLTW